MDDQEDIKIEPAILSTNYRCPKRRDSWIYVTESNLMKVCILGLWFVNGSGACEWVWGLGLV